MDVVPVFLHARFDDRVAENIVSLIVGLVHLLKVFPVISGHVDFDVELPVLALVLHHSLVLNLPVLGPFVVLDQADATATKVEVRLVLIGPFNELCVLGTVHGSWIGLGSGIGLWIGLGSGIGLGIGLGSGFGIGSGSGSGIGINNIVTAVEQWEMLRLDGVILVLNGHHATFGPDRDRPVCADIIVRPIKLDIDIDFLACRQCEWLELIITLREDTVVMVVRCLDHVVLARVIPERIASASHAALVPSMGRHVHCLLDVRTYSDCVPRAFCTTVVELSIRCSRIVKHEEVVRGPASCVVSEVSVGECGVE